MYVIDADADGGVCVLVEVRTETETDMATDALIDGHAVGGLIISLRSL